MEDNQECPIEGGYVIIPRYILRDCRDGLITRPERNLVVYIRTAADRTGVCHCSMRELANEAFNNQVSDSYINKILRLLKRKGYIWYEDRNGRRGSFDVHLHDWFLKDGVIKSVTPLFNQELGIGQSTIEFGANNQPKPVSEDESQSSKEQKMSFEELLNEFAKDV